MKYTISGFSQKGVCELRLSADDVNILRWFCDFRNSGKMVKEYCAEENCFYYWVKYSGLIESLPYLFYDCKTEETQKKKLQRILNGNLSKVLKKKVVKKSTGTYTFFTTIDEQMEKLLGYATGTEMSSVVKHIGMEYSSATGTGDTAEHWNESFQPKDSSINDSSIKKNNGVNKEISKLCKDVVEYLNEKAGTKYRYNSDKTKELIKARVNEGYEYYDFTTVIDIKCAEWLNTNMSKYLRPITLFSNKFESYLNQGTPKNNNQLNKDILSKMDF